MQPNPDKLIFKKAGIEDISLIHLLAEKIWRKYYPGIISNEQIEYMLDKMYSPLSLQQQINAGSIFWLSYDGKNAVGYLAYMNEGNGNYFLDKLYVNTEHHRSGVGSELFDFVFSAIEDLQTIHLKVNRKNHKAINFYFKNGFVIEAVKDFDIGDGFEMNDFVMIKRKRN